MSDQAAKERSAALTEQGAAALKAGDRARAQALLGEAIRLDPRNERAWLWMSGVVTSVAHRRQCLERVLAINPANEAARRGLANLGAAGTQQAAPPAAQRPSSPPPASQPSAPQTPPAQAATPPARPQQPFDPLAPTPGDAQS
ncbi:MAG: hypothetical protein DIU80_019900, partial [Chloroflexota bacterium]